MEGDEEARGRRAGGPPPDASSHQALWPPISESTTPNVKIAIELAASGDCGERAKQARLRDAVAAGNADRAGGHLPIVRLHAAEVTPISRVPGTAPPGARDPRRASLERSIEQGVVMPTDRLQRLLPLSGALFTAVLVCGLALTSGEPDNSASPAEIYAYWHGHHGVQLISNLLLIPFGVVFLLCFTAALRSALRSGEAGEAVYSPLALAGGITAAVGLLVTGIARRGRRHRRAPRRTSTRRTRSRSSSPTTGCRGWSASRCCCSRAASAGCAPPRCRSRSRSRPSCSGVALPDAGRLLRALRLPALDVPDGVALYRRGSVRGARPIVPALAVLTVLAALQCWPSSAIAGAALATAPGTNGRSRSAVLQRPITPGAPCS